MRYYQSYPWIWKNLGTPGKGAAIGLAAMLPFVPGMLGSRKKGNELRDIYSGEELVPIRSGRWWEVGSTAFEGARIKEWRPHWSILHKSPPRTRRSTDQRKRSGNIIRFCIQTRDFRPLPCFGTIEKNYRKHGEYSRICIHMNRLPHHVCPSICAQASAGLAHHIQNCATLTPS
jgi:hypothetical protein